MRWLEPFAVTWHDPGVRVKFAGIRYGMNHMSESGGVKRRFAQMLSRMRLGARVNQSTTARGLRGGYETVWFEVIPTKGILVPNGDVVTYTRPDGSKISFGQSRGESVNKGEAYYMVAQIDEGVDAAKGGTLELIVGGRKCAVIRIQ